MELLSVNASRARRATLNGRRFLVAPITMIVEGVLSGSKGSLHYPGDEISRSSQAWNGIPITVYHPQLNGLHVSARHPSIASTQQIGTVYNASTVTLRDGRKKLKAEGWFDEELTRRVDNRVYEALVNGKTIEVSTGLFTENVAEQGQYNGRSYDYVARNYVPDHLAVLPDQVGACSLHDGCGLNVNSSSTSNSPNYSSTTPAHECHCGGKCEECKERNERRAEVSDEDADLVLDYNSSSKPVNQAVSNLGRYGNPQCGDTGRYLSHGSGTGKGEQHKAAKTGFKSVQEAAEEGVSPEEDCIDPERNSIPVHNPTAKTKRQYHPIHNSTGNQGDLNRILPGLPTSNRRRPNMALSKGKRAELIQWITVNCDCWKSDSDVDTLNQLSDEKLIDIAKSGDRANKQRLALNAATRPFIHKGNKLVWNEEEQKFMAVPKDAEPTAPTASAAPAAEEGMEEREEDEELYQADSPNSSANRSRRPSGPNSSRRSVPAVPAANAQVRRAGSMAEWFLMAPDEAGDNVEAVWNEAVLGSKRERAELIRNLSNHLDGEPRTRLMRELDRMPTTSLRTLQLTKQQSGQAYPTNNGRGHAPTRPDYSGAGGPPIYNSDSDFEEDDFPSLSVVREAVVYNQQQHNAKYRQPPMELTESA